MMLHPYKETCSEIEQNPIKANLYNLPIIITHQIIKTMNAKEKVLATMKEVGQPLNAGKIAELSGLDRKEVDAAMIYRRNNK